MAVVEELFHWRHSKPQAVALSTPDGRQLTWVELYLAVHRIANALGDQGCKTGDRVAILAPNSLEYVEAFVGVLQAGACVVPLPTGITAEALTLMLDECEPGAIFVHADYADVIADYLDQETTNRCPAVVCMGSNSNEWLHFSKFKNGASDQPSDVVIEPETWFNIIYSSGTTGRPKGIVHTHGCRQAHIDAVKMLGSMSIKSIGSDSILLLSTSLYSNTTLAPLMTGLAVGAETIVTGKYDTLELLKVCESRQPTHMVVVPVQINRMLHHPEFDAFDLGNRTVKITSSAKLPDAIKRELVGRWPGGLMDGYGQTEGGPVTCWLSSEDMGKPASVGRAVGDSEIRIIDHDGKLLPPGQKGEIIGRSAAMMWGYFKRPELTERQKWRDEKGREFQRSGDIGMLDDDGYLYVLDRSKDVIISGGFNIYASDLEDVIIGHPDVADVAVIAVPSERWGETPLAIVVPGKDRKIDQEEVLNWANSRLGKIQRISGIEVRNDMPRSDIGKVLKRDLRSQYCDEDLSGC